jgi:hypothetical protein
MVKDDEIMKCPHGCEPSRWLTKEKTKSFFDRMAAIDRAIERDSELLWASPKAR